MSDNNTANVILHIDAARSSAAPTADKLTYARTIELTDDVVGSTQFDGSQNVQISTTIADTVKQQIKDATEEAVLNVVNPQIEQINNNIDDIEDDVTRIDAKLLEHTASINTNAANITSVASRTTTNESSISSINTEIAAIKTEVASLESGEAATDTKIDTVKAELNTKIDTTKAELNTKIDTTQAELDTNINTTKTELNTNINTVQTNLDNTATDIRSEFAAADTVLDTKIDDEVSDLKSELQEEIDKKLTKPEVEGTNGQVLKTDGAGNVSWTSIEGGNLPDVTTADNDKVLQVVNGGWDIGSKKINEPTTEGVNGSVLTTNGTGTRTWTQMHGVEVTDGMPASDSTQVIVRTSGTWTYDIPEINDTSTTSLEDTWSAKKINDTLKLISVKESYEDEVLTLTFEEVP